MNKLEFNLGQKKKLEKYINYFKTLIIEEEEKKESEDEEIIINKNSTQEEVSNFLRKNSKLSQEIIDELGFDAESLISATNTFIDEIEDLNEEEKENLKKSLKKNQENLNMTINDKSTEKEVSKYLKVKLNFSNKIIDDLKLDGKMIFNLEPNYIDKLSQLNKEEKDKFKNILIELQKTNKHEPIKNLTKESTEEEVTEFFVKKLNFSEDKMKELGLDGQSLFLLEIKDIDDLEIITDKEKEIFKEYLIKIIKKPEPELKITYDSNKNDIANFLIKKINLKKDIVEKLDMDGETLLFLDEKDINEINILSKQEKDGLIKVLKEINIKITDKSNSADIIKFLKLNLDFEDKSINDFKNLTGRNFLNLKDEDINKKNNISEKDKKKLKKYLNLMNITINKESDKETVAKFLKIKLSFSLESIKKLKIDGKNLMSLKEENIEKLDIKKEEKDKLKNLIPEPVQNIKIIEHNCKYIGFFILALKKQINNFKINIFENQNKIENNIIHIAEFSSRNELYKLYIYQVFGNKEMKNISITINYNFSNFKSQINFQKYEIFFYFNNLKFKGNNNNYFFDASFCTIIKEYLSCFFDKQKKITDKFKSKLLKALLKKIRDSKNNDVEIYPNEILKLFKFCCKYQLSLDNINSLKMIHNDNEQINTTYYINDDDLSNLEKNLKKSKFLYLLIEIYSNYDYIYLLRLMKSKSGNLFSRGILDLLMDNKNKILNLLVQDDNNLKIFQKILLKASEKKDDINNIIKLSKGLYNNLLFIKENMNEIYQTLNKIITILNLNFFTNYELSLNNPEENEDIDKIISVLSEIINLTKDKNKIINCDSIFESMLTSFENRELNDIFKLHKIFNITEIKGNLFIRFYDVIHQNGLNLIKNKNLKPEEIRTFILEQDIYYYNEDYEANDKRDPDIFKYIPITDEDENYLDYIELIKKHNLWRIFLKNKKKKKNFYNILIEQMKKIIDFKNLFDIFPINQIDIELTYSINKKLEEIIYKDSNELNEIVYEIFDNWLIVNYKCNSNLNLNEYPFIVLQKKKNISNYFFHLLKTEKMNKIRDEIKQSIINFFMSNNNREIKPESLIELLSIADKNDKIYFLNQLDNQVMEEKDFYNKEETKKFLLFKLFFEKCYLICKNNNINEGQYYLKSIEVKNKIFNDLYMNNVPYHIINDLIKEDDIFYKKILVITDNSQKEAEHILNKFKENMMRSDIIFRDLELIHDFYTSFYSVTKRHIIDIIKSKIAELKKMNVSEIIKIDKLFEENKDFNYEAAKADSINIKYKNSCFFMSIYNKNKVYLGIKTEDEIYKNTIKNFKETLTKIINQKDTKEPFFGIQNIEEIMEVIREPKNNLQKEIFFIGDEFKDLNKNDYIKNDLLNELINYSKKDKIKNILRGIIDLIDAYKYLSGIQLTYFMELLKILNKKLNSIDVIEEDIKNSKSFLLKYGYDIEKESAILDFYELFIDKKNSILFLKVIWEKNLDVRFLNELIDESDSSVLQTSDIDNLSYTNIFSIN